jgi:uncharacterized membrane protein
MKDPFEILMGKIITGAILISWLILLYGGILYLKQHAHEVIHVQNFYGEPTRLIKVADIFHTALKGMPDSIIQLGLVTIVVGQVIRVFLTGVLFIKQRDWIFVALTQLVAEI